MFLKINPGSSLEGEPGPACLPLKMETPRQLLSLPPLNKDRMKFERNTVIGFVLLAILFFGYFWFNSQEQNRQLAWKKEQDRIKFVQDSTKRSSDSIARFNNTPAQTPTQIIATAAD